jgi:hypothetical protein
LGGLNIAHTRLQNIGALSQLTVLQGDLVVWDNPALRSLSGLGLVTQMYGKLWIDANPLLQDLNGLQVSAWLQIVVQVVLEEVLVQDCIGNLQPLPAVLP